MVYRYSEILEQKEMEIANKTWIIFSIVNFNGALRNVYRTNLTNLTNLNATGYISALLSAEMKGIRASEEQKENFTKIQSESFIRVGMLPIQKRNASLVKNKRKIRGARVIEYPRYVLLKVVSQSSVIVSETNGRYSSTSGRTCQNHNTPLERRESHRVTRFVQNTSEREVEFSFSERGGKQI